MCIRDSYTVGGVDDQGHLKSTDPTTGKVIEGDKNVTYVYKLKETPDKPVEPTPVSYTHLDVYKRQLTSWSQLVTTL